MNKHTLINTLVFPVLLSGCVINDNHENVKQEEFYYTGKSIELYINSRDRSPNRLIALPDNNNIYVWSTNRSYNDEIKCKKNLQGEILCSSLGHVVESYEISVFTNDDNIIT
jgi:hypothetical protein